MKYDANRDIPKAVREKKTLSPKAIIEWVKERRTEKDSFGKRRQVEVSSQSISMWFIRHPDIKADLERELQEKEIPQSAISEALFENGVFNELPIIIQWHKDLVGVSHDKIRDWTNRIKRLCLGNIRIRPEKVFIENWGLKHPEQISLQTAKDFVYEVHKAGYATREWKLALRSFLSSKGIVVKRTDISGELEEDAGKYADLFVSKEKLHAILEWLKSMNYEAYLSALFSFKTGARIYATLNADSKYFNYEEHKLTLFEKAKKRKRKRKIIKYIPSDLWELIKDRKGKLFRITETDLNNLLRSAYKAIIPEIEARIPMPFHFWRHMFAQHMLRAKQWNYSVVAKLGGWTTQSLERYYGKMPFDTAIGLGKEAIENL